MSVIRAKNNEKEVMQVRAKVGVQSVTVTEYSEQTKMTGVATGTPEDNTYAKATPCLSIDIMVDNPDVKGFFKPGKKYYVDFSEASE